MLIFISLTITHYILYVPGHGFVHLIGLDKMSTHVMGFEPMIKVLSTYILTNQLVNPRLTMPHLVIPGLNAQLVKIMEIMALIMKITIENKNKKTKV